jgi:hypothetical protein
MNADPFRERPTAADYEADIAMWLRDREPPDMMQIEEREPPQEWPFAATLVIAALIGAAIWGAIIFYFVRAI